MTSAPEPPAEPEPDAASDAGESETLAESPTTQPPAEAEPDAAATAAEAGPSEATAVEPAVEQATPEEVPTTRRRSARAPAWAWVAITLTALMLAGSLATLAFARNANPSTPEAVKDAQTLVTELEALNGYLATTNQLLSDAITKSQQLSANAQAKLAGLSSQLGDTDARVGQARSLLGSQLSKTTRSELGKGQEQLQSLRQTLAQRTAGLEQVELGAISRDVAAIGDEVGAATGRGSSRADSIDARIAALESKQVDNDRIRAVVAQLRVTLQAQRERAQTLAAQLVELRRAAADQLKATLQVQRERAQTLAAQLRELRRTVALLRRLVDRLSSRP